MLDFNGKQYLQKFIQSKANCPTCKGSGVPCECRDLIHYVYVALASRIPVQHMPLTLDRLEHADVQEVKKKISQYVENLVTNIETGRGIFLYGGHGSGKTSLGCIVLKEAVKAGKTVYFASLQDCVNLVTGGWKDFEKREEFQTNIINSDLLLIDDIGGTETSVDRLSQSTLTSLFKERSNGLKATIITSNFKPYEVEERFGARLYSMIMQHLLFIECTSEIDYRQHSLSENKKDIIKG